MPSEKAKRWNSGRYIMMASCSVMASRKARSVTLRIIRWLCITPLGKPVVPEVYMRKARSSGSTASARAASAAGGHRRRALEQVGPGHRSGRAFVAEHDDASELAAAGSPGASTGTSSRTIAR